MLPNGDISHQSGTQQHFVRRLQHALEVRWVSLRERQLLGQSFQRDAPGEPTIGAGDLEDAVQAAGDG
jgi:hypothetical protein